MLNYPQCIVIEETFHHAITIRENQCSNKSQQLLFYIKSKDGVGKSRVVNAIHIRFIFLERQPELLLAILIGATITNISEATIYGALSIINLV